MRIFRHCHERLPGGTRRWLRLARAANFHGTLKVYGYGTVGRPAAQQRKAARTGQVGGFILGDYTDDKVIRVWVPSSCAPVIPKMINKDETPIGVFAHELGHHRQYIAGRRKSPRNKRQRAAYEAVAERYGRLLLRSVA